LASENDFPKLLLGKLWHTTSLTRYNMIMKIGQILPNPTIPEKERWGSSRGREFYPYARFLGGISLFDFADFKTDIYCKKYPLSSWTEFVPYRRTWGKSVWIEINRKAVKENFVSGKALLLKWKREKAYHHNIMPIIEAAHIGPIGIEAINCVYKCGADIEGFQPLK
jgi:hypothetical protein